MICLLASVPLAAVAEPDEAGAQGGSVSVLARRRRWGGDLSAVMGADPGGLTVLVGAGRLASLLGGLLRLAAPAAEVSELPDATGLGRKFRVYPNVEAAISSTGPR